MPFTFEYLGPFRCGRAVARGHNSRAYIDRTGKVVGPVDKFTGLRDYSEGLAVVEDARGEGIRLSVVDLDGKALFKLPQHASVRLSDGFSGGLLAVEVRGRWGFVDRTGRFVITPRFSHVSPFKGGWTTASWQAGISSDRMYFVINREGRAVFHGPRLPRPKRNAGAEQ